MIALLASETPDFISPSLWPPNSPDLNLVDYKICAVMQEMVYKQKIRDVDELRERIVGSLDHLDQSVIDSAISQWRTRLQACVRENGRHLEHRLDFCIQYLLSNFCVMIRQPSVFDLFQYAAK